MNGLWLSHSWRKVVPVLTWYCFEWLCGRMSESLSVNFTEREGVTSRLAFVAFELKMS